VTAAGELLVVRHGETEWSRSGRHTGVTDVALTEAGRREARALRGLLAGFQIARSYVSPSIRATETARLAGIDAAVDDDLVEWDYGDYEGLTTAQIREQRPQWTIWSGDPPGGESAADVSRRADRVIERVHPALADGDVLVIGHGHFGSALTARYLQMPIEWGGCFALQPARLSVLGSLHERPAMHGWNIPPAP